MSRFPSQFNRPRWVDAIGVCLGILNAVFVLGRIMPEPGGLGGLVLAVIFFAIPLALTRILYDRLRSNRGSADDE